MGLKLGPGGWGRFFTAIVIPACSLFGGYGDPDGAYPDLPGWQERSIITLTNACRMAPQGFRDVYIGIDTILKVQNYPAVPPLYWNLALNRAAHTHAVDMAENHGLSHSSSDGTSFWDRLQSYYPFNGWIGENIAYSRFSPQGTMLQWLLDASPYAPNDPAPDNTDPTTHWPSGDGHRQNIMNDELNEVGGGYAEGPVGWQEVNPYWVLDCGGDQSQYAGYRVPAGTHLFIEDAVTTFMANYYDPSGAPPASVEMVIGTETHPLSLQTGEEAMGTYTVDLPAGLGCRSYYFLFEDGEGITCRYPEEGWLVTYGEGECSTWYTGEIAVSKEGGRRKGLMNGRLKARWYGGRIVLCTPEMSGERLCCIRVLTLGGRSRLDIDWKGSSVPGSTLTVTFNHPPPPGMYLVEVGLSGGLVIRSRLLLVR